MLGKTLRVLLLAMALGVGLSSVTWGQVYAYGDTTVGELRNFDYFLDSHPAVQRELYGNPGLINSPAYVATHPELREFLFRHPGVREEIRENPRRFLRADRRFDRFEDRRWRDRDDWRWRDRDRDDRRGTWGWRDGDHDRDDHWRLSDRDHDRR